MCRLILTGRQMISIDLHPANLPRLRRCLHRRHMRMVLGRTQRRLDRVQAYSQRQERKLEMEALTGLWMQRSAY